MVDVFLGLDAVTDALTAVITVTKPIVVGIVDDNSRRMR